MFISLDQPRIMLYCFAFGGIFGFISEVFYAVSLFFKCKVLKHAITCFWCVCCAFLFVFLNFYYNLGNFRLYKLIVIIVGTIFYYYSFHKIIAIFINSLYNKIVKKLSKLKKVLKKQKNVGTKKEKSAIGVNIGRNYATVYISGNNSLSNGGNSSKAQRNKKVRRGNLSNTAKYRNNTFGN